MVLVDTHALLWYLDSDDRMGSSARRLVEKPTPIYFSAVSILEIAVKGQKEPVLQNVDIAKLASSHGFEELILSTKSLHGLIENPLFPRHDPFDQALISQAKAHRLDFLTADQKLLSLGLDFVIDATR